MGAHETMEKLEQLRKKIRLYRELPALIGGGCFILGMVTTNFTFWLIGIIGSVVTGLFCGSQLDFMVKDFRNTYKNTFVNKVLKSMIDDIDYDWHMGFVETEVMSFGIIKLGNHFSSEDYLSGSYKGVKFRQADVSIYHETGTGKNKTVTKYFNGRMFEFDYTGKNVQNLKVFTKRYVSWLNLKGDEVELEDVGFNNMFNVYAPDKLDAFYLLTPPMMEKLKNVSKKYANIAFRFSPNKLYVGIDGTTAFDAEMNRKLSYPDEYAKIKKEVQTITDIIEIIGLIPDID